jgi:hypothetical protein
MRHSVVFAVALSLVGLSEGLADPPQEKEAAKMGPLADWPLDAPIELRPRVGRTALDQRAAEKKARQYLGIDKQKGLRSAPAYLTDKDFPFLHPEKRAVWLVEVRDLRLPGGEPKPVVLPQLYVAIDAKSGQLLEAFTAPAHPWWREKKQIIGPAHEKFFRETGQALRPPAGAPKLSLSDALRGMADNGQGQIVVRYGLYSNQGQIPAVQKRPALLVFREGVQIHTRGGEIIGRCVIVLDAETGALLHNESYGNPQN